MPANGTSSSCQTSRAVPSLLVMVSLLLIFTPQQAAHVLDLSLFLPLLYLKLPLHTCLLFICQQTEAELPYATVLEGRGGIKCVVKYRHLLIAYAASLPYQMPGWQREYWRSKTCKCH